MKPVIRDDLISGLENGFKKPMFLGFLKKPKKPQKSKI